VKTFDRRAFLLGVALALPQVTGAADTAPTPAIQLLEAHPFRLQLPFTSRWRAERPQVDRGFIVVLEVGEPALLRPRQTAEPVLYAGLNPVERVNTGYPSGRVVAIVAGDVDLARTAFWLGSPELPERVDASVAAAEAKAAAARGVLPFPAEAIDAARGEPLAARDRAALDVLLAEIVERHAPEEKELIRNLREEP
jgi:hypothetical protein